MLNRVTDERRLALYTAVSIGLLSVATCLLSPQSVIGQDGISGPPRPEIEAINILDLLVQGGFFMIPILLLSLLVVTFTIERFIGLRRTRVLPEELVAGLGQLGGPQGGFDPRKAYKLCQQYPSAAATVVRAMLLKIGRPHSEVEHAVSEASDREANRLYANVRWLILAAAVAPLLGLLGTVWGILRAFHDTTQLTPDVNKADYLAEGIYVALVTTLGGLCVAIPAAIFAHFFEGRVQTLFHQIDEMLFNLMPQVERFEGRVRFGRQSSDGELADSAENVSAPPVSAAGAALK
ncbi:MAG: MotA/TolQ/ExbB proton channel family protein [Planctomycetes bacterium]|nr:MotA/TolQ/ExbB proton channel family protein [Planctomycetota bacterium]